MTQMNLPMKHKQTYRQNRIVDAGGGGAENTEFGISRCRLYRRDKQQGPTVAQELYSIACDEPKNVKNNEYVCITESLLDSRN